MCYLSDSLLAGSYNKKAKKCRIISASTQQLPVRSRMAESLLCRCLLGSCQSRLVNPAAQCGAAPRSACSRSLRMTAALWLTALATVAPILTSGSTCNNLPWCLPKNYDKKKPPFLFDTSDDRQLMNIHYAFSIREVSKVMDSEQTLQIPMYFTVSWTEDRLIVDQAHMAWGKSLTGEQKGSL